MMSLVFCYKAYIRALSAQYEVALIVYQKVIDKRGFFLIECNLSRATSLVTIVSAPWQVSQEY